MTTDEAGRTAVDRMGRFLSRRIGLRSEGTLRGRLRRSIGDEAAVRGEELDSYVDRICRGDEDIDDLVDRLTVQESGFFRHPEHFDVLTDTILPALTRPVTIWSAACGNGQEAYSLAMLLEEQRVPGRIVASDLSPGALTRTADAVYSDREIAGLSAARRQRHLVDGRNGFLVAPRVQARVTSLRHNLVDPLPDHVAVCDVVLCRNVLIYLSAEHSHTFLDRLADALSPGAYLILGAAESLWQVSDRFEPVRIGGAFVYRRRDPASHPSPSSGGAPLVQRQPASQPVLPVVRRHVNLAPYPTRRAPRPRDVASPRPSDRSTELSGMVREAGRLHPSAAVEQTASLEETTALEQTAALEAAGKLALADGDHEAAVVIFRKCAYLAPHNPMGAFHLGLALEAGGHHVSARRAYAVALAALEGAPTLVSDEDLEGFARDELVKLLDAKRAVAG